jgi:hypothetical protein
MIDPLIGFVSSMSRPIICEALAGSAWVQHIEQQ